MKWDAQSKMVVFEDLPPLPYTNADMAGALMGNRIYLAGGSINSKPGTKCIYLDMSDTGKKEWKFIPNFPGSPRLQPVAAAQNGGEETCLFLFGGFNTDPENNMKPQIMTDGYKYIPSQNSWTKLSEIMIEGKSRTMVGTSAIPAGTGHILFVGGVNKEIFFYDQDIVRQINQADNAQNKQLLEQLTSDRLEYWMQPPAYFRFNRDIITYHTITNTWIKAAEAPWQGVAGAAVVKTSDGFIVVNGEIKPGVRTNEADRVSMFTQANFGMINYLVLFLYLIGMLLLGFYFMKRTTGTDDFFQGGQRIPWWAAGISIFATALSAITFLSIPAKAYATDWRMLIFNIAIILVVPIVIRFYLPFFRKLNVASAYQYLENRFNRPVRFFASGLFCFFMITRIAIVLFLPSIALNAVTGLNVYFCILVMGLITIAYCTMGGVEAVIWGDVIQGFVLVFGALIALLYMISGTEDGLGGFITMASESGKFHTFDFSFNWTQPVFWVTILGGLANQLITYTSDQSVIQRYMTTKDKKAASRSIWLNGILSIPVSIIFFLIGTGLYTFYRSHPQNLNMTMQNQDAIFPHFMVSELPVGLAGLLIAAVFSAAMSTLSSNINSVSTAITEDFFQQIRVHLEEKTRMRIARISGILVGLIGTTFALGLATWDIKSLWDQFNVFLGLLTSGLGGLFLMGICTKRINGTSAMIGLFASILLLLLIRSHTQISFLLFGFIGLITSFVVGWLCSFIINNKLNGQSLNHPSK
ncbi:MAG: sodium/solute symporter [Bacteroidales bacterium]|jgi:cyclically-permuted mutarotase family protein|nr:sodium/solute symporter [Bacteroidales bacterium]